MRLTCIGLVVLLSACSTTTKPSDKYEEVQIDFPMQIVVIRDLPVWSKSYRYISDGKVVGCRVEVKRPNTCLYHSLKHCTLGDWHDGGDEDVSDC